MGIGEIGGVAFQALPLLDRHPPVALLARRAQRDVPGSLELPDPRGLVDVAAEAADGQLLRRDRLPGAGKWILLPQWSVITAATAVFSNHAPPPDLNELVRLISPRPIFLIYTPHGQGAETLNRNFYAAARGPKTLWEIPEADHTGGITARPHEYERRVIAFFDSALLREQ